MIETLCQLFVGFLRASNLGFGGGPAVIPLIQAECVRYSWMSQGEFANALAVANALPGPIATKLAAYVGYQVAAWPGVIIATVATIMPTILILILLNQFLKKHAQSPVIKSLLKGVRPAVAALMAFVAYDLATEAFMLEQSVDWITIAIALVTAIALAWKKIHPAILIVCSMVVGYFIL